MGYGDYEVLMEHLDTRLQASAIICGSGTPVGSALAARLHDSGTHVITIDLSGGATYPQAALQLAGNLADERDWRVFAQAIQDCSLSPAMLAYAICESDGPVPLLDLDLADWNRVVSRNLRGAYLACKHLFPLLRWPGAAVLLASVLAAGDARADLAALSASSGGMLALARSLALSGAPLGVRVNTVCCPAPQPPDGDAVHGQTLGRIPLGRATGPNDLADAMMFLLSDDAGYLTGSSLVVDGGQSLQSWSNAPDVPYSQL
jgi:NAD(P)-dependent dehydrogenase (short-subunit alcohol dehydrogenase family)